MLPHVVPAHPAPLRLHVTAVFVEPVTLAANCCCAPMPTEAVPGETVRLTLEDVIVSVVEATTPGLEIEPAVTVTDAGLGAEAGAV
jgi:hypothetical protein